MKTTKLLLGLGGTILLGSVSTLAYGVISPNGFMRENSKNIEGKTESITFKKYKDYVNNQKNNEKVLKSSISAGKVDVVFNSKITNTLIYGKEDHYSKAIKNLIAQNSNDLFLNINGSNSPAFEGFVNYDGFGNYYSDRYNPKTLERVVIQNTQTKATYYSCDGVKVTTSMCNKHFSHPIWTENPGGGGDPTLPNDWVFTTKAKGSKVKVSDKEPGLSSELKETIDGIKIYKYNLDSDYITSTFTVQTGNKEVQKVGNINGTPQTIYLNDISYKDTLVLQRTLKYKVGSTELNKNGGYIASFDESQNMFDNLLIVDASTSSYTNDGNYYFNDINQNPKFKFGLNLPFVTASYQLKNIYKQAKELISLNDKIITEYAKPSGETIESLFGSKNGYFSFINKYIQNILDAKYNLEEIKSIISFFNDLLARKITKSQIDSIWSDSSTEFPLLSEKLTENWVAILKENNKDVPKITNENAENDRIYFNKKLVSLIPVNSWNSLFDYIIPEFLNQKITANLKINGEEREYTIFDNDTKEFQTINIPLDPSNISTLELVSFKTGSGKTISTVENVISRSKKYQTIEEKGKAYLAKDNFSDNLVIDERKFSWLYASEKMIANSNKFYKWNTDSKFSSKGHRPETRLIIPEEAYDNDETEMNMYASELASLMWFPQKYAHKAMGSVFMPNNANFDDWMLNEMPKYVNNSVSEAGAPIDKYLLINTFFTKSFIQNNSQFEELTGNQIKEKITNGENVIIETARAEHWLEFFTMPEFADTPLNEFYANDYTGIIYTFASYSPKINDANKDSLTKENGFYKVPNTETLGGAVVSYNYVLQLEVPKRKFKANNEQDFINIFENINKPNIQEMVNQALYDERLRQWVDSITPSVSLASEGYPDNVLIQPKLEFNNTFDPNSIKVNGREMVIRFPKSIAALVSVGENGEAIQIPFSLNDFAPFAPFKEKNMDLINNGKIIINEVENTITWSSQLVEKMLGIQPYPFYVSSEHINWDNLKYGYDFETGITTTAEDVKTKIDAMSLTDKINYLLTNNVLASDKIDFIKSLENVKIEIVDNNGVPSIQVIWVYKNDVLQRALLKNEDVTVIPPEWVMVEFKPWEEKIQITNENESWEQFKIEFGKPEFYSKFFDFNTWAIKEIRNIVFNDVDKSVSFDLELKKNFIPSIGYRDSWTLSDPTLNWDTSTKFKAFEIKLTLMEPIIPRADWEVPVMVSGITLGGLLIVGLVAFILIKKHKQKKYLTEDIKIDK